MTAPPPWRSPWPFRALWLVLPVLSGPALADALADRSRAVQVVASLLAWGGWLIVLAASLVPRTVTLTVVRLLAPGALAVSGWAALDADDPVLAAAGVGAGALCLLAVVAPGVSDAFVDGSSYGAERRVALRMPFALALGPLPVAWLAAAVGIVAGPLLLATEQWLAGAVALVVGLFLVVVVVRQFHVLSRRWLVFVPAGVVVHDPMTLSQPVLFQRHLLRRFGPALAGSEALDTTAGALGLALELEAAEPIAVGLRRGRTTTEVDRVTGVLVTPAQPATTLEIAAEQRLPVG